MGRWLVKHFWRVAISLNFFLSLRISVWEQKLPYVITAAVSLPLPGGVDELSPPDTEEVDFLNTLVTENVAALSSILKTDSFVVGTERSHCDPSTNFLSSSGCLTRLGGSGPNSLSDAQGDNKQCEEHINKEIPPSETPPPCEKTAGDYNAQSAERASEQSLVSAYLKRLVEIDQYPSYEIQLFAVIDHGTSKALVQIWSIETRGYANRPRIFLWKSLRKTFEQRLHLSDQVFGTFELYVDRQESPEAKIKMIEAALKEPLRQVTRGIQHFYGEESSAFREVPVLFRSSEARDVPTVTRETMMYAVRRAINDYQDGTQINVFTSPHLTAAKTGVVEGIEAFYAIQLVERLDSAAAIKQSSSMGETSGVLDLGSSTLQLAFALDKAINDGATRTVEVEMPVDGPQKTKRLHVFSTSFVNYGVWRALALLTKQHCVDGNDSKEGDAVKDGVCWHPCMNPGWRQDCRIGTLAEIQREANGTSFLRVTTDALTRPAAFCSETHNPAIRLARLRESCEIIGLSPSVQDDKERSTIPNCRFIVGTGNAEQCATIVAKYLTQAQLPANQDAIFVGTSAPCEVGNNEALKLSKMLRVVGSALSTPVAEFIRSGWLPANSTDILGAMQQILPSICSMSADPNNFTLSGTPPAFLKFTANPPSVKQIPLNSDMAYVCFRLTYIVELLKAFGALKSDKTRTRIVFPPEIASHTSRIRGPSNFYRIGGLNTSEPAKVVSRLDSTLGDAGDSRTARKLPNYYERTLGMILRVLFTPELPTHLYVLGAPYWKRHRYMSPLADAIKAFTAINHTSLWPSGQGTLYESASHPLNGRKDL